MHSRHAARPGDPSADATSRTLPQPRGFAIRGEPASAGAVMPERRAPATQAAFVGHSFGTVSVAAADETNVRRRGEARALPGGGPDRARRRGVAKAYPPGGRAPDLVQAAGFRSSGRALPPGPRARLEQAYGADLGGVRVHAGSSSDAAARAIQAQAFTRGADVHFAAGAYRPSTHAGFELLAHEVAHTLQRDGGHPRARLAVGAADSAEEREADAAADAAVAGRTFSLARTRPASNGTVRRRVGVEAEISMPIYNPRYGAADGADRVASFLTGGVQEGNTFQGLADGFHIETDHDKLSTESRSLGLKIAEEIEDVELDFDAEKLGNMEYVSEPFDEETAQGYRDLKACVEAMAEDMNDKYETVIDDSAPAGGGLRMGVPRESDWQAFAVAMHLPGRKMEGARNFILGFVKNSIYLQVTAGILPGRITNLMERAAKSAEMSSLTKSVGSANTGAKFVKLLTTDSVAAAKGAIKATRGLSKKQKKSSSLLGYLSLVVSYLHGNYFYRGKGTTVGKNMVSFLAKQPLNKAQEQLDTAVRPDQMDADVRAALGDAIVTRVKANVDDEVIKQYWQSTGHDGGPLGDWENGFLRDVLAGRDDGITVQWLCGRTIESDTHRLSKDISSPDEDDTKKQGLIPLEFRHIEASSDPDGLWTFVDGIVQQVKKANAKK